MRNLARHRISRQSSGPPGQTLEPAKACPIGDPLTWRALLRTRPSWWPASPRIISVECPPPAYRESFTHRTDVTGEATTRVSKASLLWGSQCGGKMMQHAFVNPLSQSALVSDEAATPHYRANCFSSVRLSCMATMIFSIVHWASMA